MLLIIEEEYEITKKNNENTQVTNCEEQVTKSNEETINISQNKKKSIVLPKYISVKKHETQDNNYYLIYDKKSTTKRNTLKALCSHSTLFNTNLELFIKKIEEKFAT